MTNTKKENIHMKSKKVAEILKESNEASEWLRMNAHLCGISIEHEAFLDLMITAFGGNK